jgi:predicted Zn-dependent protease with MMP-like domain
LLQTKECNHLTQKAFEDIAGNVTSLMRDTVELVKIGVQDKLDSVGLNFDDVPGLSGLFETDNPLSNPSLF